MISTTRGRQCEHVLSSGKKCSCYAVHGDDFCFMHSPSRSAQRADAQSNGGKARHGRVLGNEAGRLPPVTIRNQQDLVRLLMEEINSTRQLERSVNRAQAIARLSREMHDVLKQSEVEQRLERIERQLDQHAQETAQYGKRITAN